MRQGVSCWPVEYLHNLRAHSVFFQESSSREFIGDFTSILKELVIDYNKQDHHLSKIYKDMEKTY